MTLYFAHSVIGRLVRRLLQETKSPKSPANTLVFESLEPRLLLAADPLGITVIEANGSTQLTEVGDHFFLYDGSGSGPSLKYAGADYVAGQFGAWAPIGAEQTASGYEVAWKVTGADQYTVWNTDSSGNYTSQTGVVSGADYALQSLEPSFHQDLNGDGQIGPPTTVIEANGSTQPDRGWGPFFPLRRQRIRPLAEICRRGLCGRSVWRLGADRRGADGKRVRGCLEGHGHRSVHCLEHRQQRQLYLTDRRCVGG